MRSTTTALFVAFAAAVLAAGAAARGAELPADSPAPPALTKLEESPSVRIMNDALASIALTRDDLSFRTDYADAPDSFRLAVADLLLERPLDTETYVANFADEVSASSSLEALVRSCARDLDLEPGPPGRPKEYGLMARGAADPDAAMEPKSGGQEPLDVLLAAARTAESDIEAAFAALTEEELRFVALHAAVLLEEEEFDPEKPIDERDREAEEDEVLADELLRIAALIDYDGLAAAGARVARAVDAAAPLALDDPMSLPRRHVAPEALTVDLPDLVEGDVWSIDATDAGIVIIGGPGRTVYKRGGAAVIIDVGGDDLYLGDVAAAHRDLPVSVVIDLSGNDTYSSGHHALGAGFMGVGVLVDLAGDDSYSAGDFSLGSGLFGVGILHDAEGNDSYKGDTCTEGAGAFGIGVHRDGGGNDSYHAALFSQAFGFVGGFGLLHDVAGNDLYFAGGKYTDEIRYFDHYISLSQGFGFGWRPDASGGVGMLVDEAGNDVYVSDIFGQGSSYWFSVGGLVDFAGNDNYVSYQYAQGAGTHITVAALVDYEGDDNYVSKGVSQGCGHDLAIGLLHDVAGDDNYTCHDLSQAAGNANGIGVLIDDAGDDAYSVRSIANTQGYGNLRRDYGSVGIFLDCSGTDSYSGRGGDNEWWTYSDHGVGIDVVDEEGGEAE